MHNCYLCRSNFINMKKINILRALLVLALVSMTLLPSSCIKKSLSTSLSKMAPADILTETIELKDSIRVGGVDIRSSIYADFPIDGCFLAVNSIQEWISEMFDGTYSGKSNDGRKMLDFYLQDKLDFCKQYLEDTPAGMCFNYDVSIKKVYETESFVTYAYYQETYLGGAHGSHFCSMQTFRKLDGRRMDWNVFQSNRLDDVRELVSNALQKDYFNMDDKEYQELKEDFMNGYFPLPQTMPVFVENGVLFQYQEYEIASYAAGAPNCIIPYAVLDTLFSNTGKVLLQGESVVTK